MNNENVISIRALHEIKKARQQNPAYRKQIAEMNKLELLDEMVRFQEERAQIGHLTPSLMVRGEVLFKALSENAETQELQLLSRSYRRHLHYELQEYVKTNGAKQPA
jgi:Tfp pilus assembly protein PilN